MISLVSYTIMYGYWIVFVIVIHWVSMFIWLLVAHNTLYDNASRIQRLQIKFILSLVYIIAYINLQEDNPKQKMVRLKLKSISSLHFNRIFQYRQLFTWYLCWKTVCLCFYGHWAFGVTVRKAGVLYRCLL